MLLYSVAENIEAISIFQMVAILWVLLLHPQRKEPHNPTVVHQCSNHSRVVLQSGYIICLICGEKWNVL